MNPIISRFRSEDVKSAGKVLLRFSERQPTADQLRKFLASDSHFFLAASMDSAWVGFAYAYELPRPDGTSMLFLYSIEVASEYRRRGVATALLSYLRGVVDERQMKELFVLANCSNDAAVAFYKATGGVVEHGEDLCFVYPGRDRAG
ncbi:MAG: GNAT family N-acetyltransferase [Verrucomicrobiia bacterium]|jgi:aminoglycoside 3-N-acetyltransferase I